MSTRSAGSLALPVAMVLCATGAPRSASAQTIEWLGTRALGMGGAFVAVADDATAVYWNPAGLATGATASGIFEIGRADVLSDKDAPIDQVADASRASSRIVATTATSFGLSTYRLAMTDVRRAGSAAGPAGSLAGSSLTRLTMSNYGVTLVQTVAEGLVVGGTLRLVRGSAAIGALPAEGSVDEVLKGAEDLESRSSTHFDLDAGVMLVLGVARAGVVVRNVTQPEFELPDSADSARLQVRRHARAGVAVTPGRGAYAPGAATTIGFDVDISKAETARGRQRDVAAGVEQWLFGRRLGVRGGGRLNVLNKDQRAASAGLSVALQRGSYVDTQITRGRLSGDQSWAISARVTF
jgi:F plasmid transfer operon protein TraF